jgi:hypothetical protein
MSLAKFFTYDRIGKNFKYDPARLDFWAFDKRRFIAGTSNFEKSFRSCRRPPQPFSTLIS